MKGPSLQKTTAVSAAIHATIFLLSMIALRNTRAFVLPSPYIVNLVSVPGGNAGHSGPAAKEAAKPAPEAHEPVQVSKKEAPIMKEQQKRIDDSIAVLRSKKKIADIVNLRKALVSIKGSTAQTFSPSKLSTAQASGKGPSRIGQGEGTYADKVGSEIHKTWSYPDYLKKSLETVVALRISKDGTISIMDIEKRSGDRIFDRSVLKAIETASPVTPPPYDGFEVGVRFTP